MIGRWQSPLRVGALYWDKAKSKGLCSRRQRPIIGKGIRHTCRSPVSTAAGPLCSKARKLMYRGQLISGQNRNREMVYAMTRHAELTLKQTVNHIVTLNDGLRRFWKSAEGWAPINAARLLSKSRLDWQVSLSACLKIRLRSSTRDVEPGRLILAYANLGALVEGTMKLFLSVWSAEYRGDADAILVRGLADEPDLGTMEPMRQLFRKRIYDERWDDWVRHIQERRNAIHAFRSRDIGELEEFCSDVRRYLEFLRYINGRLPYPGEMYVPRETV